MRLRFLFSLALSALSGAASCSGDSSTGPATTPPSDSTTSPAGVNIAVDSAFAQRSAVVGTTLPAKVRVTLGGVAIVGAAVTWTPTHGGTVSAATTVTDTAGYAITTWTLGDTVGTQTLVASITGASVNLVATTIAGPATTLTKVTADSSAVVAGGSLLLTVRTTDSFGNVVGGIPVSWSSSGGSLSVTSTTTGSTGQAEVAFTTPPTPGSFTVTASVAGFGTAVFKVVGM